MGRASQGPQLSSVTAAARRAPGGPSGYGMPVGPPVINVLGPLLFSAASVHPSINPPVSTQAGVPGGYPVLVRSGRAALDGKLWDLLVRHGATYRVKTLSELLWRQGVGTHALAKSGANRALGEERLREELHAFAYSHCVPLGADVADDDGHKGFGVLRDREACRRYAAQRMGRHKSQVGSLTGLLRGGEMWFALGADERPDGWPCEGVPDEQRDVVLHALGSGGDIKGATLTQRLWETELAGLDGSELEKAIHDREPAMRSVVASMRKAGVPITASPGRGYRLASSYPAVVAYVAEEEGRLAAVREGARRVLLSGALWYPETEEEREAAARWRAQLHGAETAPSSERRAQRSTARKDKVLRRQEQTKQAAAQKERELMESPAYARFKGKQMSGQALTRAEKELAANLRAVRRTKKTGQGAKSAGL